MAPPKLEHLTLSLDSNPICLIKFNRPKNANAVNGRSMQDLVTAFTWALNQLEIRIVLLTGGGNFFSVGMDLVDFPAEGPILPDSGIKVLSDMHKLLINTDKVLIAAANGPAVDWGASSIALFDLVYSVPDAFFFTPFVKWGLAAEACSSFAFARIMGRQKAASLILATERMTAQELESAGMITKIVPRDKLLDNVMEIARRIAKLPSGSLSHNKRLMLAPIGNELLAANDRECQALRERARTNEPRDAVKAFEEEMKVRRHAKL